MNKLREWLLDEIAKLPKDAASLPAYDHVLNKIDELAGEPDQAGVLRTALEYYADPEHWRTKNASESLANTGYGMGYHRTNPDGQMETLAAHCGHWVASKHMVHGGHWQADAGHVARQALRQAPALAGGEAVKVKVKPLEWKPSTDGTHHAVALGLVYHASRDGKWGCTAELALKDGGASMDEAKSASQADFERRILSAITHPAPTHEDAGVMVHYGNSTAPGRPFEPSSHTSGEVTEAMVDAFKRNYRMHLGDGETPIDFKAEERKAVRAALEAVLRGDKA